MNYSHFQHRHNFAVWCAARAVQRKFAKTPFLKEALEKSGVVEFIRQNEDKTISQEDFEIFSTCAEKVREQISESFGNEFKFNSSIRKIEDDSDDPLGPFYGVNHIPFIFL